MGLDLSAPEFSFKSEPADDSASSPKTTTQIQARVSGARPGSHHEAMLLAVVGHQDDVAVGGPDEAGQLQVVLRSRRGGLHRRDLVGLDAAELRRRVQHPDASQQAGVHLGRGEKRFRLRGAQVRNVEPEF